MKLRNKILTILLSGLMVFSVFSVACNNNSEENPDPTPVTPTVNATSDFKYNYLKEGTLHNIKVDFDNPVGDFVKNGQSNYVIIYNTQSRDYAQFLQKMITKCTGVSLPAYMRDHYDEATLVSDLNSANPDKYYILLECEDLFTGEIPALSVLGVSGAQVKTVGKNVFINAYNHQGYQMGALAFLREVTGYDYVGYDTVYFGNSGEVLPQLDIVDRPDFDFRQINDSNMPREQALGQGFSTSAIFYSNGTRCPWVHNCKYFVGARQDTYFVNTEAYSDGVDPDGAYEYEWFLKGEGKSPLSADSLNGEFVEEDASIDRKWLSSDATMWQCCYTAHGDVESYLRLVKRVANMLIYAMVTTDYNNIMHSANDVTTGTASVNRCACQACNASYEYYGFTMGGAQVSLLNDAVLRLNEFKANYVDPETGEHTYADREFNVVILAYGASLASPTKKVNGEYVFDEKGNGIPMTQKWFDFDESTGKVSAMDWEEVFNPDEYDPKNPAQLTFVENAQVMYASSGANWTHTFREPENISRYTATKGWAGLGGKYYIWAYEKCYYNYFYPYPVFDSMFENYRYFKGDLDSKYIYSEGTYENVKCPGFSMLLEYMNSKALYNVNYNYQDVLDTFFERYYDKAAPYMREMFDAVQIQLRWAEKQGYYVGTVHNDTITYLDVLPYGTIQTCLELIDKAYAAIEEYKYTNPDLYESLYEHILIESLFPRFSMCTTYDVYLPEDELLEWRLAFKRDFDELNPKPSSTPKEHERIGTWNSEWGIL